MVFFIIIKCRAGLKYLNYILVPLQNMILCILDYNYMVDMYVFRCFRKAR